jgi:hypothetical protein
MSPPDDNELDWIVLLLSLLVLIAIVQGIL